MALIVHLIEELLIVGGDLVLFSIWNGNVYVIFMITIIPMCCGLYKSQLSLIIEIATIDKNVHVSCSLIFMSDG